MGERIRYEHLDQQQLFINPGRIEALTKVCSATFAMSAWYGEDSPEAWYNRIEPLRDAQDLIMVLAYDGDEIVGFTWGYRETLEKLERDRLAQGQWRTSALDPVRAANADPVYYFAEIGVRPDYRGAAYTANDELMSRHLSECLARGYDSFLVRTTTHSDFPLRWFRDTFNGRVIYGPDDYRHKDHLVLLWVPSTKVALSGWKEVISRRIPLAFLKLMNAAVKTERHARYLASADGRYPLVDGIPILLKRPDAYLLRLRNFLEEQLRQLWQRVDDPGDRFWAEPQYAELQKRLQAIKYTELLSYDVAISQAEPHDEMVGMQMDPKYDGEPNTDIYTRIAWGYRSSPQGESTKVFPDAGELYTTLATSIGETLPVDGVFLEIGCGVGRTVFDAAQVATDGMAIGMDISFSKVARAQRIVRGDAPLNYCAREQFGLIEVQVPGQFALNTLFAVGDGMDIRLPNDSVDCVAVSFVMDVVYDPKRLLHEIFRVLKPGGVLIIANSFDAFYSYERPSGHRLTPGSLAPLLEEISPRVQVTMTGPITYSEFWSSSRTVTYKTSIVTARKAHK